MLCTREIRVVGWSEHSLSTNVIWVRFPNPSSYVGWVGWFSLVREVFPRVLRFFPYTKKKNRRLDLICRESFWFVVSSIIKATVQGFITSFFEITVDPFNLIGFEKCDLLPNRTIFCSKWHYFPSQWGRNTKTKQPIRFQGLFKAINQTAVKLKTKKTILWRIFSLSFPTGSIVMVIEQRVVQARSFDFEITRMISDQIAIET